MALYSDTHDCSLDKKDSLSLLPGLHAQASWRSHFCRKMHKCLFQPTQNHPQSSLFFRSTASLVSERKRYVRSKTLVVLHPFSNFNIVREIICFFLWTATWNLWLYYRACLPASYKQNSVITMVAYSLYVLQAVNSFMYFFTGYLNMRTKEIHFTVRESMCQYLKTFCIIDFGLLLPVEFMDLSAEITLCIFCLKLLLSVIRMPSYLNCLRHMTYRCGVKEHIHKQLCLPLIYGMVNHWATCLLILASDNTYGNDSFLASYGNGLHVDPESYGGFLRYLVVMCKVLCIFQSAGLGIDDAGTQSCSEQLVLALVLLIAFILNIYLVLVFIQLALSINASDSKYAELVAELDAYMSVRGLPDRERERIRAYYRHRYQNHYFKETAISAALSEHLLHEIFLTGCMRLIDNAEVLQGISRFVIGQIITCLKPDVFLENDIVFEVAEEVDCVYFISYGTLAVYTPSGEEVLHLEDGALCGIRNLGVHTLEMVATETTEVFRWNLRDYTKILDRHPEFERRVTRYMNKRDEMIYDFLIQREGDKYASNVLHQLGRGKILDQLKNRKII